MELVDVEGLLVESRSGFIFYGPRAVDVLREGVSVAIKHRDAIGEDIFGNRLICAGNGVFVEDIHTGELILVENESGLVKSWRFLCANLLFPELMRDLGLCVKEKIFPKRPVILGGRLRLGEVWRGGRENLGFYEYLRDAVQGIPNGTFVEFNTPRGSISGGVVRPERYD